MARAPTRLLAPPAPVTLKSADFGLLADAITHLGLERGYFAELGSILTSPASSRSRSPIEQGARRRVPVAHASPACSRSNRQRW
jgi:hypothetical protein